MRLLFFAVVAGHLAIVVSHLLTFAGIAVPQNTLGFLCCGFAIVIPVLLLLAGRNHKDTPPAPLDPRPSGVSPTTYFFVTYGAVFFIYAGFNFLTIIFTHPGRGRALPEVILIRLMTGHLMLFTAIVVAVVGIFWFNMPQGRR